MLPSVLNCGPKAQLLCAQAQSAGSLPPERQGNQPLQVVGGLSSQCPLVLFGHHPHTPAPPPKKGRGRNARVDVVWEKRGTIRRATGTFTEAHHGPDPAKERQSLQAGYIRQVQPDGEDKAQPQGQAEGYSGHAKDRVVCPQLKTIWRKMRKRDGLRIHKRKKYNRMRNHKKKLIIEEMHV